MTISAKQSVVLRLLSTGLHRKQVATQIGISERTVESHVEVMLKLSGSHTTAQLIFRAVELGWLVAKEPPRCIACGQILPGH